MADVEIVDVTNGNGDVPAIGNSKLTKTKGGKKTAGKTAVKNEGKVEDKTAGAKSTVDENAQVVVGGPEKNPNALPIIIAAVAAVVVIILAIVAVTVLFKDSAVGFGDTASLAQLKSKVTGEGADLAVPADQLKFLDTVPTESGVILREGSGDVAEKGKQATINYKFYANVSDEMIKGQQGGTPYWQEVESSWTSEQGIPVEITTDPIGATESATTNALTGESTSTASAEGDTTMTKLSGLLSGQKIGTVIGFFMPASAQSQVAQFILAELDFVSEVGADPTLPEVSTEVPANAPVIKFDDAGVPTGLETPEGFTETENIVVKVLSEGTGEEVKASDAVTANYAGFLLDGTEFDASFKHGSDPIEFSLDGVIKGWKAGLAGQKVGSKVMLLIPSKYGYGEKGSGDKIPANSYLVFYIDIVSKKDSATYSAEQQASQQAQSGSSSGASGQQQQSVDPQTGLPAGYSLDAQGNVVGPDGQQAMSAADYQQYLQQMQSGAGQ